LKESLVFNPPYVQLPKGPGLGVELDMDAVKQYQINEKTYK
jgi:muconate cycloisomerase